MVTPARSPGSTAIDSFGHYFADGIARVVPRAERGTADVDGVSAVQDRLAADRGILRRGEQFDRAGRRVAGHRGGDYSACAAGGASSTKAAAAPAPDRAQFGAVAAPEAPANPASPENPNPSPDARRAVAHRSVRMRRTNSSIVGDSAAPR